VGKIENRLLSGVNKVTDGAEEYPVPPPTNETEVSFPPEIIAFALADVVEDPTNVSGYVPFKYPFPILEIAIVVTLPPEIVAVNTAATGEFITAENVTGFTLVIPKSIPVPSKL